MGGFLFGDLGFFVLFCGLTGLIVGLLIIICTFDEFSMHRCTREEKDVGDIQIKPKA